MTDKYTILPTPPERRLTEVSRSYSYKLNLGNYQSADFFCAQKITCYEDEAEEASQRVYDFCRRQVMLAVRQEQARIDEIRAVDEKRAEVINQRRTVR